MAAAKTKSKRRPPDQLRDVDRAFIHAVMFESGILPMEKTTLDMRRALNQLSPEEARQLKRKFRKLWRRAMREETRDTSPKKSETKELAAKQKYGVGKHVPSRAERNARKQLVFTQMWEQYIVPLLENFERAGEGATPKP